MPVERIENDDGIITEARLKYSGVDGQLEGLKHLEELIQLQDRRKMNLEDDLKKEAERAIRESTANLASPKKAIREIAKRQQKDALDLSYSLRQANDHAIALDNLIHSKTIDFEKVDLELKQYGYYIFECGLAYQRLSVRPFAPAAKTGRKMHKAETEGGKSRSQTYKDSRGAAYERITLIQECYEKAERKYPGKTIRFLCQETSRALTKTHGKGFSASTVYRIIRADRGGSSPRK